MKQWTGVELKSATKETNNDREQTGTEWKTKHKKTEQQ